MTNSNGSDRLDRIEAAIERTQRQIGEGFQRTQQQIEGLSQRIDSNAKAIEALSANIAANRTDIATTRASVDGLVQTITEYSARTEERLNRLDDAIRGINTTNQNLEHILEQLLRNQNGGNGGQPRA